MKEYKNMEKQLSSITIEIYEDGIEWLACDVDKDYSGYWQRSPVPLTTEEIDNILKMLENKTKVLYTSDMNMGIYSDKWNEVYNNE